MIILPTIFATLALRHLWNKYDPRKPKEFDNTTDNEFVVVVGKVNRDLGKKLNVKQKEALAGFLAKLNGIDRPKAIVTENVENGSKIVYFLPPAEFLKTPRLGAVLDGGPIRLKVESTASRWYRRGRRKYSPVMAPTNLQRSGMPRLLGA